MMLSGAISGHLYPPSELLQSADTSKTVFKHVDPQDVGTACAIYGNFLDSFVAECVKTFDDGSVLVILPDPQKVSAYYYNTARKHSLGHVGQHNLGQPLNHKG
jgi:hypothetical protein